MKALWLDGSSASVRDVPSPRGRAGWARIAVLQAGICGTDVALASGMYGFRGIPGHEFVGRVVAGPAELRGRRVVADINVPCRRCPRCRASNPGHCSRRRVLGIRKMRGAFADFATVPVENLVVVPARISDDAAVFAEPLAAALDVLERIANVGDQRVLVVGPGRLGQLVVRVLLRSGARVSCLGRGTHALGMLPAGVARFTSLPVAWHGSFRAVVDCSGSQAGLHCAIKAAAPRGVVIVKSTTGSPAKVDLDRVVINEIRLQGSRCGSIPRALHWLARGYVDPTILITAREPLARGVEALRAAASPVHMKVLLHP